MNEKEYAIQDNCIVVQFQEPLDISEETMREYFLVKDWYNISTLEQLSPVEQRFLHATFKCFQKIENCLYIEEDNAIVIQFNFDNENDDDDIKLIVDHVWQFVSTD